MLPSLFTAYAMDVAGLLLRWLHLITGIAWIGSSFYFVWLDNSLTPPKDPALKAKGVGGELWAVHGGGFYNPQKYLVAPRELPADLHWFKWEAYSTWITGFFLLGVLYYAQAATYLVDPSHQAISPTAAVGLGLGSLVGGWLVYDRLCRLFLGRSQLVFGAVYFVFVVMMAGLLTHFLSGRAAFLHVGAMVATTMAANVFFWIIPGQRKTVAAMQKGETPDPVHGQRAKQRSVHNNYLTLPVLFCMISNHYAFLYNHPWSWALLTLVFLGAVLIRHWFNQRHRHAQQHRYLAAGGLCLALALVWAAPQPTTATPATTAASGPASGLENDVADIVQRRCQACHSLHPSLMAAAPAGVILDTPAQIRALAPKIIEQAVHLKAMPLGNVTAMTEAERETLARWNGR